MSAARATIAFALLACGPRPTNAQDAPLPAVLHGRLFSIENGEHAPKPLSNVLLIITHLRARGLTDDQGQFRIQIPSPLRLEPGREIALIVDSDNYAVWSPIGGKVVIPADRTKDVEIRMLPKGSKLFWTHERIEEYVARFADESARQIKQKQAGQTDLSGHFLELAHQYGFTPEEVRLEIGRWMEAVGKDATDSLRRGLANFAKENFGAAARDFIDEAVRKEQQGAEKFREAAEGRGLAGDAYYYAGDYRQALAQYQKALKSLDSYRDNLGGIGIKVYPEYTANVANLSLKTANARANLGIQVAGPDGPRHLDEAVRIYERLIAATPRAVNPGGWAMTQNNLGVAFQQQGERLGGAEGAALLARAVDAYRLALEVYTRQDAPMGWVTTQHNLGSALSAQGERTAGVAGATLLAQAVDAYRLVLDVYTREHAPQQWATTQNNLGTALSAQGERTAGAAGAALLAQAVDAYRRALEVFTRQHAPQPWAATQNNLGTAFQALAARHGLTACLQQVAWLSQNHAFHDDPAALAPLHALAVVCQAASGRDVEARRDLDDLVSLVERQPDDFHLAWDWRLLRDFITGSEIEAVTGRRQALLRLIDAVSRDDRTAILAGLRETQRIFVGQDGTSEKAPGR